MDQQPAERKASIEAAAKAVSHVIRCVLALPNAKREAWVLNGFDPKTPKERKVLEQLREEIGLDPCEKAHRLNAPTRGTPRDAKRALSKLTDDNREREQACWLETEWKVLRSRGVETGLTQFLADVKEVLVSAVIGAAQP
jgi:hypothetical protein